MWLSLPEPVQPMGVKREGGEDSQRQPWLRGARWVSEWRNKIEEQD